MLKKRDFSNEDASNGVITYNLVLDYRDIYTHSDGEKTSHPYRKSKVLTTYRLVLPAVTYIFNYPED